MASSFLKTFSFILYGVVTFLLLCAVLVLIFKDDKPNCPNPALSKAALSSLLNETESIASSSEASSEAEPAKPYDFTGEYELVSSENFDEFLTELGIGYFTRLAATRASSRYVITKEGDQYTLKTISTFGQSQITFKSGEEFNEDRLDGETVKTVIQVKNNKWIQKQKGEKEVTIIRDFSPEQVTVTSVINNVASVRVYKKTK